MAKANPNVLVSSLKATSLSRLEALATEEGTAPEESARGEIARHADPAPMARTTSPSDRLPTPAAEGYFDVDVDDLHEGPWNARKFYIETRIDKLATSLKEQGQEVPVNAYRDEHSRLVLQDGHYRLRAAKRAGLTTLRVQLKPAPADAITAFMTSRAINLDRNDQSVLDDAFRLKELTEARVASQRELSKRLGLEEADVSKLLALTRLPENIILTVMADPSLLSKRFLYNLSLFFDRKGENETLQLAAEAVEKGMSARDLEARLRNAARGPREKPRSDRIDLARGQIKGFVKAFPMGRVELRLDGLSAEEQGAIVEKLRRLLPELEATAT